MPEMPAQSRTSEGEAQLHERLSAVQCLKNAHGHIATAYAQIDGPLGNSPGRRARVITETLDAVDWIRRALEHMEGRDA